MENGTAKDPRPEAPEPRASSLRQDGNRYWGLLSRRTFLVPTLRGWITLGLVFAVIVIGVIRALHPFLALNNPLPGGLLVVEGWAPDYGMEAAIEEFKKNHYEKVYVTGGPLEHGSYLSAYKTYAQLGAASLVKLGLSSDAVEAVPAPEVRQDRTYTSAVSLKRWLAAHHVSATRIHLISEGPHSRRSCLLYEKALGRGVAVGVTAIPVSDYDPQHWWRYSAGVRSVIGEALAYLYAKFLFFPADQ